MDRVEFTSKITMLLLAMIQEGEHPILDYAKRSDEEQHRLWQIGRDENGNKIGKSVTNCDGVKNVSGHQRGRALDILFIENGTVSAPKKGWIYWHDEWVKMGGGREISWDEDHFE
jgi:D-alanyl-D-alanine dipeptidase